MGFPWESAQPLMPWQASEPPAAQGDVVQRLDALEGTLSRLQADARYIVTHTAVLVHATGPHAAQLGMLANTKRGQLVPTGVAEYGEHTIEFRDIGMPQVGVPEMSVQELCAAMFAKMQELGIS